jgi:hypothetical protein
MSAFGRRNGALFGAENLDKLEQGLGRSGIKLVRNSDALLTAQKANAAFERATNSIYLKANPTRIEVIHELSHAMDYRVLGEEAYEALGTMGRERSVFERMYKLSLWKGVIRRGKVSCN